jgi:CheY-like chemotaxis protein
MKNPRPGAPPKVLRKRILVAEDEPGVREALVLLLSLDGHNVTEATNGKEALEIFQTDRFDVVITDYAMPTMKGDELAANINQLKPTQPVIMISAHAQTLADSGNPLTGIKVVLAKPFMLADLREALANVLADQGEAGAAPFLPN